MSGRLGIDDFGCIADVEQTHPQIHTSFLKKRCSLPLVMADKVVR